MEKVYLKSYLKRNLGDDLFVHIITNKYKNILFESISSENYDYFEKNLIVKKETIINKILKHFSLEKFTLENKIIKKNKIIVILGGSIFIENKSKYNKNLFLDKKKYFILGANFGPYKTEKYYNDILEIFKNAEDVCFRDEYSFNLFKTKTSVRFAPDIVFSFDTKKYISKNQTKQAIISVIDCSNRIICNHKEEYENAIVDIINNLQVKGYKVTLMSFCKFEGDEEAIEAILKKVKNVNKYFYRDNLDEALCVLGNADIIVGSRFHANILGLAMNKVVIPFAYSDKTINALKDINYKGTIIDIRNIENFNIDDITEKDLSYKINIDKYRKEAEKHFEELDKILK